MESAIPTHLRTERSRTLRIPDDYTPPVPAYVARFKPSVSRVVMAYFGVQYIGMPSASAGQALNWISSRLNMDGGATHWDRASYIDEAGYTNVVTVGYWDSKDKFEAWFPSTRAEWTAEPDLFNELGRFIEVLSPSVDRYETLSSSLGRPEGVAAIAGGMSGEIQEHAYWGGMRDRMPLSQNDAMKPSGEVQLIRDGVRLRVVANENLCLIRSGQDWSDAENIEREMYVKDVEPVLREGMDFLRDEGTTIGCYANRYMTILDAQGKPTEKTYGMSWWRSLAALERWAESHPTHVAIFGAAMKYLKKLGPAAKLRLYHEVSVVRTDEQFFEYFKCHDRTGMLRSIGSGGA